MNIKRAFREKASDIIFGYRRFTKSKPLNKRVCRILMYHSVENSNLAKDRMGLAVPPSTFYMHMRYLKENGFHVMNLLDFIDIIKKDLLIPENAIVITFDDGFRAVLTNASSILKELGFTATLFVNIYFLEGKLPDYFRGGDWQTLNWEEIKKLYDRGFSIGSHALTHRKLTEINNEETMNEIVKSKELIEKNINGKIYTFSFPHGSFNNRVKKILRDNNFHCACTSINGVNNIHTDIFALRRTEITAFDDSPLKFEKKILGCYDWLATLKGI